MKTETIIKLAISLEAHGVAMNRVSERLIKLGRKLTNELLFESIEEKEKKRKKIEEDQNHRTKLKKIAVNLSTQKNEKVKAELWRLFVAA